jgi:putative zinc finger/helix-turn-helix YgiT family protein
VNSKTAFCENCREDVRFSVEKEMITQPFKGEDVEFANAVARCDSCGSEVFVAELHDSNLVSLYDAYRLKNGIIAADRIREIPGRYAIGKRPLSLLMGWGELTFTRYCDGDMPSKQYADILKRLYDEPEYFLSVLEENKGVLSPATYRKSKAAVQSLLGVQRESETKLVRTVKYILSQCDDITNLALQKSLYYVQGFYFAFHNSFIFEDDCEAWVHGPVYREIYNRYSNYGFDSIGGESGYGDYSFTADEKVLIDSVINYFCCYSGKTLERFTHVETPWLQTRGDLSPDASSDRVIDKDLIGSYFAAVQNKHNMLTPADIKVYATEMFEKI